MNDGDFVRYEGDSTSLDPLRRNETIAKIISSVKNEDEWRVLLEVNASESISCPINFVRPISTDKIHLKRLGFEEIVVDDKKRYVNNLGITISGMGGGITIGNNTSYFVTGYCLGDLTNIKNTEMQNYINNEGFDKNAFNMVYPNLNNINSVFRVLEENGVVFDKREILDVLKIR